MPDAHRDLRRQGRRRDRRAFVARLADAWPGLALAGYLNDRLAPRTALLGGAVLGPFDGWPALPHDVRFLAPLHKAKEMPARHAGVRGLGVPDERWATLIDPGAIVAPNATVGAASVIGPFVVVGPSCVLGRHCHVLAGRAGRA